MWQMNAEALEGAPAFMKNLADRSGFVQQQLGDKSSRVPSETKQIGRALADIDITPVIPHSNKPRRSAFKNWTSIDSEIAVRPDQFQIQSLTLRDFMSGKFLPASGPVKYTYNDDDENFDERTSKYIFLSQSAMTDRVGLHGHNTFGNGSKTDNSRPSLIRVDFGNDMFAKDDSNNLIYGDDGLPMRNAKSEALFNKILQHNKKIAYTFDGQQREYSYASITPDGYEEGFVPVATRANGTMIMLREDVFTRTTKEDLERMGVSALDNYVPQNYRFKNKTEMFKTKEAVNRSLTDSVKISDLGRAELTPEDVMKRMAFVDFGAFVKDGDTALDGTSFAAPGVLPAGAAVIRMGFNAIKGTMAELDFRNYIKHLTGNDSLNEFYMPSMGATDEMKKFFATEFSRPESQGNMRNAFTRRFEGKSFDDYFVNVMDENLSYMFSNTMVKTPWLKESGLTQNQIRERVAMMMFNDGKPIDGAGFRLHHTDTEKITTDQATLSHTLSRLLMMDDDDVRKEASVFATRIGRLINDPEYAVREVFNNPNDEFHQMIRENPALAYTDERAQRELQTEIDRSYKDFYQHRLSSRGRAAMGLAVIDPYYAFAPAAAANGQTINPESIHLGDEDIAYSPASMGRPGFVGDISAYRNPLTPGQA